MSDNRSANSQKKVIVGMSGGVDSSVSAYLLKEQGYQVEGLFMKNWEEDDNEEYCTAAEDLADAQAVCDKLDIPLHTINFAAEYWDNVFEYFLTEYKSGRTPNPDILCNKEIKFKAFVDYAESLGADYIATGHYAQIKVNSDSNQVELHKGLDPNKDQTYFLHALSQKQLTKAIFPIGSLLKPDVRQIAKELKLITHDKKDSTGICFIGERKFKEFLKTYIPANPGDIVDENNNILGKHDGLMYYTIGQRQGLNLGGLKGYSELPWFVAGKNLDNNTLLVVQGTNNPKLYKSEAFVQNITWTNPDAINILEKNNFTCMAKTRYRQPDQECTVSLNSDNSATVKFREPQRAITPGQSMVFYFDTHCLGGGVII